MTYNKTIPRKMEADRHPLAQYTKVTHNGRYIPSVFAYDLDEQWVDVWPAFKQGNPVRIYRPFEVQIDWEAVDRDQAEIIKRTAQKRRWWLLWLA